LGLLVDGSVLPDGEQHKDDHEMFCGETVEIVEKWWGPEQREGE
jgi:hypothetical protein